MFRAASVCATIAALALALVPIGSFRAQAVSTGLVISQVYGGGGNSGATYTHDYVELHNRGTTPASVAGWSLQYASATGTANFGATSAMITELPAATIAPGQYFLVQEAQGAGGTTALPTPDATDATPILMSATAGKVALVNTTAPLGCNGGSTTCGPAAMATIVDLVGYGAANFFEGSGPTAATSNTTAALRNAAGCAETDDNSADFSVSAPTPRNTSAAPHSCAGDSAPSVTGSTPANGAANVALAANIDITFSEPVNVAGSWHGISCTASGAHTATQSGGPTTFTLDPVSDFAGSETCTVTVFAAQVSDQDADDPPDTMTADHAFSFATLTPPVLIREIQGASHRSPKNNQTVSGVSGIVTAKLGNGFYMQDPAPDADAATSEAIFVFTSTAPTVLVGDAVTVSGRATEFRPGGSSSANLSTTEIDRTTSIVVNSSGNPLPPPTIIGAGGRVPPTMVIEDDATGSVETSGVFDPLADGIDFYESLEAMRVQVPDAVVVGPRNNFGEITVLADGGAGAGVRTSRGGIVIRPIDFNPERILLDDGIISTPSANVGDGFTTPVIGVLDYSFGNFKLNITQALTVVPGGIAREAARDAGHHELAVATYNVENLDPLDGSFARHAGLIVDHLRSPDLIAIEEIQDNDGPGNATGSTVTDASVTWNMLIDAITAAGGPRYDHRQIDPVDDQDGGEPGGNIRVGFLFRTDRGLDFVDRPGGTPTAATTVVRHGSKAELSFSPGRIDPTNPAFDNSRKPLAGEFTFRGERLFVVANHFNSKGGDHPLFGRFQPPIRSSEVQRHQQAQIVNDFVDELLAIDEHSQVIVLGDINDFEFSETVSILEGDALRSLMHDLPQAERYSYVFEGNSQVLDQILLSRSLLARPIAYDVVHVNSEFADQASDHEPQVAFIALKGPPPGRGPR